MFKLRLEKELLAFAGTGVVGGRPVVLLKPNTFMNRSGVAISRALLAHPLLRLRQPDLLIVTDDIDLPFGRIRLRMQGSSGGHNGLRSVEHCISSRKYARLKLGIGKSQSGGTRGHVLRAFLPHEQNFLEHLIVEAIQSVEHYAQRGPLKAMSIVNASARSRITPSLSKEVEVS